jgi:hypothetical protein
MLMRTNRRFLLAVGALIATLAIALPVLAASPSPSTSASTGPSPSTAPAPTTAPAGTTAPAATAAPAATPKPTKELKGPEDEDETPEVSTTVSGTVTQGTDGDGHPSFSVTAAGTTWTLSAGPPWFWGDKNPLQASVGKSVIIVGHHHAGSTELEVETVDGKAIRAPGKPPWAGGPWVVGKIHPGWKSWMADGKPGHGHGRDTAPGQNKVKDKTDTETENP